VSIGWKCGETKHDPNAIVWCRMSSIIVPELTRYGTQDARCLIAHPVFDNPGRRLLFQINSLDIGNAFSPSAVWLGGGISVFYQSLLGQDALSPGVGGQALGYSYFNGTNWGQPTKVQNVSNVELTLGICRL